MNNPFASKKLYFDKEYYTRGIDDADVNNANQDRDSAILKERSRSFENLPIIQIHPNIPTIPHINNEKFFREKFGVNSVPNISIESNVRTFHQSSSVSNFQDVHEIRHFNPSRNIVLNSGFNGSSGHRVKNDHEVTFITYT